MAAAPCASWLTWLLFTNVLWTQLLAFHLPLSSAALPATAPIVHSPVHNLIRTTYLGYQDQSAVNTMDLLFGRGQAGWQVLTLSSKAILICAGLVALLECIDLGNVQAQASTI